MTPQAYDLAAAQNTLAAATTAAEKCADTFAALQARTAEKQRQLSIIQQRRVDGGGSNEDAPMVHLLQLDIAGLEPLVDRAAEQHQSAVEAQQAAQMAVQHAQTALERATAYEAATALESRLRELEKMLLNGISELHTLKKKASGSLHVHGPTLFNVSDRLKRFLATGVLA